MSLHLRWFVVIVALIVFASFTRGQDNPTSQPAVGEPVDFRKLKEIMPAKLIDLPQRKNEGEKVNAGAIIFSHATAEYGPKEAQDDSPSIKFEVIDYTASKQMADAATSWQNLQIDREGDDGWQKSTKLKGQPAMLTFQNEGRAGQAQVFIGNRYYVHLQSANVSSDDFKKVVDELPIEKIAAVK